MYFKSIEIENIGPIEQVQIDFPLQDGQPKPVIIVGENGTGKSILLSHLVNCLITGKQEFFDDVEVEHGKVYKYRSPSYIRSGKDYSYSSVKFVSGIEIQECQLNRSKNDFETILGYVPARTIWNNLQPNDNSIFLPKFQQDIESSSLLFNNQCCLYFPVNRFEEPAWLNLDNLKNKANYSDLKHISRFSNRNIICISPLKNNKDWLLDLIFDRHIFESHTQQIPFKDLNPQQPLVNLPVFLGYRGQSTEIYEAVLQILKIILREPGDLRLGAGGRKKRQISVIKNEMAWVPNLFQLSTGEVQLLNMFLSILRDYDLSNGNFDNLKDIKGIVIIDEIDSHLHTSHQKEVLPELIALFPNVQFIITTHSPLFLMGMEEKIGSDNFIIFNMPKGEQVVSADFSEFNAAYEAFKNTEKHREEIQRELKAHSKPIVYVEGDYDIRYLRKASELLKKNEILEKIHLKDGKGSGNLKNTWNKLDKSIAADITNKLILLFDCDTDRINKDNNRVFQRVMPFIQNNPINIGIENLFPSKTIQRIEELYPHFIDFRGESEGRDRGNKITIPAIKTVNKNEKNNLCNWLCENGTIDDFINFTSVFSIIEEVIDNNESST